MKNLSLRIADENDVAFLAELFYATRKADFLSAGLSEAQIKPLLAMQFQAQRQSYETAFPHAENLIVEFSDEKIGRLLISRGDDKIHLIDVALLANFRGKGVGSKMLEKLQAETKEVILSVFKDNLGAIRLYKKYNFAVVRDDGMYLQMEWKNAK